MPVERKVVWRRPKDIPPLIFNDFVRVALEEVGRHWQREHALQHFEPGAEQRYQMPARTAAYRRQRQRLAAKRGEPVRPLVFRGTARELARERTRSWRQIALRLAATGTRQTVRVPIPIGHAIPHQYVTDFGALTRDEIAELKRVGREALAVEIQAYRQERQTDYF